MFIIVDDTEILAELLAEHIKLTIKETVLHFADPFDALDCVKENINDEIIVITDYKMPRMNGIQLFDEIIKIKPNVKCTIFTSTIDLKSKYSVIFKDILNKFKSIDKWIKDTMSDISEEQHNLCPDCQEPLTTVVGDRADLSYGEFKECQNTDCSNKWKHVT